MPWIKGIPVTLYEKTQTDEDAFHDPVYTEMPVTVENVLVTPADAGQCGWVTQEKEKRDLISSKN